MKTKFRQKISQKCTDFSSVQDGDNFCVYGNAYGVQICHRNFKGANRVAMATTFRQK